MLSHNFACSCGQCVMRFGCWRTAWPWPNCWYADLVVARRFIGIDCGLLLILVIGKKFDAKFEARCRNFLAMKWIWKDRFQNGAILSKRQFEYVPRCYSTSVLILQQNMTHDLNDCYQSYYASTKSHPTLGKYADRSNSFDQWIGSTTFIALDLLLPDIHPNVGEICKIKRPASLKW